MSALDIMGIIAVSGFSLLMVGVVVLAIVMAVKS